MAGEKDRITIEDLTRDHLDSVYRYAHRLTGSSHEAEDLVQETFLVAASKIDQLRDPARANAWLIKILRGHWCRTLRRRLPTATVSVEEIESVEPGADSVVDEVDPERLQQVLGELPEEYREPLLLFYFEELMYREISEVLEVPVGTVMSRLARAKAYLRDRLSAAGSLGNGSSWSSARKSS